MRTRLAWETSGSWTGGEIHHPQSHKPAKLQSFIEPNYAMHPTLFNETLYSVTLHFQKLDNPTRLDLQI